MYQLWQALEEAKKFMWVDLSLSMNNESPFWCGIPEGSVELGKTCYDWGNEMLDCLIQTFKFPGQFGTHIDFPGHFAKGGALSEKFGVEHMVYPLCVIDITEQVSKDIHYAVTVEDILAYERKYTTIPEGAFVALRTDWSKKWPDMAAVSGTDEDGNDNFPGWSLEALKFLYEERNIAANGHETLDTDASSVAANAGDLVCERYVLSIGKLQVELLTNLDKVKPAGAVAIIMFPHFEGATGLPVRVLAITE